MRLQRVTWAFCVCVGLFLSRGAQAEPLRLHGVAAGAHAFTDYQKSEFGWGAAGELALELPFGIVEIRQDQVGQAHPGIGSGSLSESKACSSFSRASSYSPPVTTP